MSDNLTEIFEEMRSDRKKHRDSLKDWKAKGGSFDSWPEGENIDDMIAREQRAVDNLSRNIEHLNSSKLDKT